jgi:hypothetical protein
VTRSRRARITATIAAGAAFTAAGALASFVWIHGGMPGLDLADKLGSVVSAVVSVGSLLAAATAASAFRRRQAAGAEEPTATAVVQARAELAVALRSQWWEESRQRSLRRPAPLRVTWRVCGAPVAGPPQAATGDLTQLCDVFANFRYRHLVCLGPPGAGKTVTGILLTLDLLERLGDDPGHSREPIPILLSLAGWDPVRQTFHEWLVSRMGQSYPWLGRPHDGVESLVNALINGHHLVPILDGFDEIPPPVQARALDAIDTSVPSDQALVITSRSQEYGVAVAECGAPLAAATVVELEAPALADIGAFLSGGRFGEKWQSLLAEIMSRPGTVVARALTTPLMVGLARAQYDHRLADPRELLALDSPEAVREHLLDAFVPAVYTQQIHLVGGPHPTVQHSPDQASRWLQFLARFLVARGKEDLDWWELGGCVPTAVLVAATALLGGGALAAVTAMTAGVAVGAVAGALVALTFGLMAYLVGPVQHPPRRVALGGGTSAPQLWDGLAGAMPYGLAFAVAVGGVAAFADGWQLAFVAALLTVVCLTIVLGLLRWLDAGESVRAESPRSVLQSDRLASLANGLAFGSIVSLACVFPAGTSLGQPVGLLAGLCVGMFGLAPVAVLFTAWGRFTLARWWLAGRGQLPLQVFGFMEEARHKGVLRRVGASYRFRHALLRDSLAGARARP